MLKVPKEEIYGNNDNTYISFVVNFAICGMYMSEKIEIEFNERFLKSADSLFLPPPMFQVFTIFFSLAHLRSSSNNGRKRTSYFLPALTFNFPFVIYLLIDRFSPFFIILLGMS